MSFNLIQRYAALKEQFKDSLESTRPEHREWAQSEVASRFRWTMKDNLEQPFRHRFWRWQNQAQNFELYNQVKVKSVILDRVFKRALKQDCADDLINLLNQRDYRFFRYTPRTNWAEILDNNFSEHFIICEDCSSIEYEDEAVSAYDGDRIICTSCCDRNYHWNDSRDTYIHDDDDDEDDGIIGEYHSSSENLGHIPSAHDKHKNPIYLGLELEMEAGDSDRYRKAEELLNAIGRYKGEQYCLLENDGSLDDGFEMVTGWTGLDVHAEQLEFFKQPFKGMRSHDTRTCGLHIHICKTGMTMSHASKLILFINESSNQRLIKAIARRENPDYAKIKNKRADYRWLKNAKNMSGLRRQLMELNEDRYEALNFKNPNTVEYRMFKGTLKYETIMACLEFTYASWHFARDTGIRNLTTEDFLAYISKPANLKTTKFLREYLQGKGFDIPTPVKKNPRIESPANQSLFALEA